MIPDGRTVSLRGCQMSAPPWGLPFLGLSGVSLLSSASEPSNAGRPSHAILCGDSEKREKTSWDVHAILKASTVALSWLL